MVDVGWSRWGDENCIRLAGLSSGADVGIRPRTAAVTGHLPVMAGRLVRDGDDACFVPRFAFVDGTTYAVDVDGVTAAVLRRPRPDRAASTEVVGIYPSAVVVPRNLLRLYVHFSAPMSEGDAARHVRLVDDGGETIVGALLAGEQELWDRARRRLTVLLDPARIKRGLISHRQAGYPLRTGESFRLLVDDGFRDAAGIGLRAGAERHYRVGGDQRGRVEPDRWALTVPAAASFEPLEVAFDRPLDHGLLAGCVHVVGPDGRAVDGALQVGAEERLWRLAPRGRWATGPHLLVVASVLEDVAGNSLTRVFDRDLTDPDDRPRPGRSATVTFSPR